MDSESEVDSGVDLAESGLFFYLEDSGVYAEVDSEVEL